MNLGTPGPPSPGVVRLVQVCNLAATSGAAFLQQQHAANAAATITPGPCCECSLLVHSFRCDAKKHCFTVALDATWATNHAVGGGERGYSYNNANGGPRAAPHFRSVLIGSEMDGRFSHTAKLRTFSTKLH